MTEPEITYRLKKLKTLAERGIESGEREAAANLLQKLCEKHNITADQIDGPEEKKMRWFVHKKSKYHKDLLTQCMYKIFGDHRAKYTKGAGHYRKSMIGTECTAAEAIEIELDYAFFSAAFEKETERLFHIFIQKNDIFPENVPAVAPKTEVTEEDIAMYRGITRHTRVQQIERGNQCLKN